MAINTDTPRPLFPIALAFISGIVVSDYIFPSIKRGEGCVIPIFIITAVIALFFIITLIVKSLRHSVLSDILLLGLCFLAGSFRLYVVQQVPANHLANFPHDDVPVYLEALVTDEPVYYLPKNEFLAGDIKQGMAGYFIVNAEAISWAGQSGAIRGKVRVSFYGIDRKEQLSAVRYGNRLQLLGIIYSPCRPTNPAEFDYGQFLRRQGIHKTLRIKSPDNIKLMAQGQGSLIWSNLTGLRNFLAEKTDGYFRPEQAGLLKALILGERPAVPDDIETKFMQTGTIHYLSVSGLHLAMLAGFLFLLLGALGVTGRTRAVTLITSALLYAVLTGLSTPVTRSLVMIAVYFGSEIFIRKSNPFNSIALAGLIIMAYNPNEVFSVGFQLSFLSVISIVSFTPPILALMRYKEVGSEIPSFVPKTLGERLKFGLKKYLLNSIAVSLAASFGVFPLVLKYFHLVTPVSIIANIALSVLVFLIMVLGFINLPLLALGLYSWLVPVVSFLTAAVVWVVDLFSRIPWAYFYLPDIPVVFVWIFYGLFFLWLIRGRLKFIKDWYFIGVLAGMLIWFFIWAFSTQMAHKNDGLKLTMLDVRQGASFVIQTPAGKTIIYDCGTFGSRDVGEQVLAPFLWNKGITRIDTLILSHSHLDHINGVQSVLERFSVRECLVTPNFSRTYWGRKAMGLFGHYGIKTAEISAGAVVNLGNDIYAEVLGPSADESASNENNLSVLLKIKYGNKAILLTGDIQTEGIRNLLAGDQDLNADILQIPHHGFAIKSDKTDRNYLEELINRVNPSEIVINTDGDETDEGILEICRARDIIIHTSDKDGAVAINLR